MAPGYMSISFLTSGLPGAEQITLNMLQTRRQSITTLSLSVTWRPARYLDNHTWSNTEMNA
jgi:hypothetical protein